MKPVWEKKPPAGHKPKAMKKKDVEKAKELARSAGRPYPNAVDNIRVARKRGS
jgi:hypothetical protein